VELEAPHLGFDQEICYLTKTLMASFKQKSSDAAEQKEKNRVDKL